ncbi:amidase family protein [Horticoccus sp. 23ND18S-11]|uniref:amidase family protein n=1 Tax=Horticoccus sp. 23ND18S-11 TaxID=3391832 RepID=UPI0039C8F727
MRSRALLLAATFATLASLPAPAKAKPVELATATVADLQAAMTAGTLTAEKLVTLYLARIAAYDQQGPKLNTILALNSRALETARALDAERKAKGPRSALHGIPILAKDVFDTADMPTTGGFKPMATSQPARDSFVIARLREAGAIILGKLNQADWYAVMPAGASTLTGQVLSPYNLKKFTGYSSSGTGASMAAWFATVGLGSDTGGSITIPSTLSNLVGFATTHGLVSRTGMMWSSPSQENGGPMGRSVYDCAAVLDAIAGYDPADLPTQASVGKLPDRPYTSYVSAHGLKGARVGVLREMFRTGPLHTEGNALAEQAIADFKTAGAVVLDPVLTGLNLIDTQVDAGASRFEVAAAINKYLAGLPADAPVRTVDEMIRKAGDTTVKPNIVAANAALKTTPLARNPEFAAALKHQESLRQALVALMDRFQLDALILPFSTATVPEIPVKTYFSRENRNNLSSYTGLPTIIVPGGFFPSDGMPFAMQFLGRPFTEPVLIKLASGYEAATRHRKPAPLTPALPGEKLSD